MPIRQTLNLGSKKSILLTSPEFSRMDVIIAESAKAEVSHAAQYYENEVGGLGQTFVSYVEKSISEIEDFPLASRVFRKDFRRFLIPRFP